MIRSYAVCAEGRDDYTVIEAETEDDAFLAFRNINPYHEIVAIYDISYLVLKARDNADPY